MKSNVVGDDSLQFSEFEFSDNIKSGPEKFSGLELQDLLVVEICAGTARLSKTARNRGIRGLEQVPKLWHRNHGSGFDTLS